MSKLPGNCPEIFQARRRSRGQTYVMTEMSVPLESKVGVPGQTSQPVQEEAQRQQQ